MEAGRRRRREASGTGAPRIEQAAERRQTHDIGGLRPTTNRRRCAAVARRHDARQQGRHRRMLEGARGVPSARPPRRSPGSKPFAVGAERDDGEHDRVHHFADRHDATAVRSTGPTTKVSTTISRKPARADRSEQALPVRAEHAIDAGHLWYDSGRRHGRAGKTARACTASGDTHVQCHDPAQPRPASRHTARGHRPRTRAKRPRRDPPAPTMQSWMPTRECSRRKRRVRSRIAPGVTSPWSTSRIRPTTISGAVSSDRDAADRPVGFRRRDFALPPDHVGARAIRRPAAAGQAAS